MEKKNVKRHHKGRAGRACPGRGSVQKERRFLNEISWGGLSAGVRKRKKWKAEIFLYKRRTRGGTLTFKLRKGLDHFHGAGA